MIYLFLHTIIVFSLCHLCLWEKSEWVSKYCLTPSKQFCSYMCISWSSLITHSWSLRLLSTHHPWINCQRNHSFVEKSLLIITNQNHLFTLLIFFLEVKRLYRKTGVLHIILKVGHPKIISTQISEQKILMWFLSHTIPKQNQQAEKNLTEKLRIYVKLLIAM